MCAIRERVLGVELKLIDLPAREEIDQLPQRRHRRDLVPADIKHHAADR